MDLCYYSVYGGKTGVEMHGRGRRGIAKARSPAIKSTSFKEIYGRLNFNTLRFTFSGASFIWRSPLVNLGGSTIIRVRLEWPLLGGIWIVFYSNDPY